ncbi:MAG: helix-turn-helix domain-containing protein [Bacteroidales bacterium]|nr:helix-turn-helix domain-containing protein [Bacteroidales bacterium]
MIQEQGNITKSVMESPMMPFKVAAGYLGFSRGYLYKLTMQRRIPHYKPNGKNIFFDKRELDEWLHGNRVATAEELTRTANEYCRRTEGMI